ncbi:MAG: hypothetical protein OEQ74_00570 [Gammaproteobacteria bacterium]|nr:hypothetical protein [Gammaproteobacteria bacterium]
MQALITLVRPFLLIVAHRAGPEHLPASRFLLALVVAGHISIYLAGMLALDVAPPRAVMLPFLDAATQAAFFSALLMGLGLQERLLQTLTAVFGADIVLNTVSVPLALFGTAEPGAPGASVIALVTIVVMLWSLGVKGHILRHAAGFPYFVGVAIALGFFVGFLALDIALYGTPS